MVDILQEHVNSGELSWQTEHRVYVIALIVIVNVAKPEVKCCKRSPLQFRDQVHTMTLESAYTHSFFFNVRQGNILRMY